MNPLEKHYGCYRPYVHSWPGQTKTHYKGRAGKARAGRAKAGRS
jgi:hypothetical protein